MGKVVTQLDKERFKTAVIEGAQRLRKDPALVLADADEFGVAGLDSLDVMNLVLEVEGALQTDFGEIDIGTEDSIESFFMKASRTSDRT